jgi:hypothetical protein
MATAGLSTLALLGGGVFLGDAAANPYTDTGSALEVKTESKTKDAGKNEIELVKERPEARFKKWDGELDFGVRYEGVSGEGSRALFTDRMEWKDGAKEVHAYPLEATEQMEDGGLEFEVVLNEAPDTNRFDFVIEGAEALDFFYQAPLTAKQIEAGFSRPENVVGSYAVYHKEKSNHVAGEVNYATGKVFHIFRPKAIDAGGQETWAELSYVNGLLSVTVPQEFLDNAAYPVRVDPTFGNTTTGNSVGNLNAETSQGLVTGTYTASTGDTVISMSIHAGKLPSVGPITIEMALYDFSGGLPVNRVGSVETQLVDAFDIYTISGLSTALSDGTTYTIAVGADAPFQFAYDDNSGGGAGNRQSYDFLTSIPATWTDAFQDTALPSMYVTYATAPAVPVVVTDPTGTVYTNRTVMYGYTTDPSEQAVLETGFAYGTDSTLATVIATTTLGTSAIFSQTLTGLTQGTTYYYRAYATNASGDGFGSILSFTTAPQPNPAMHIRSGGKVQIGSGGSLIIQ